MHHVDTISLESTRTVQLNVAAVGTILLDVGPRSDGGGGRATVEMTADDARRLRDALNLALRRVRAIEK